MHGCRLLKFSNCFKFISQQLHAVAAEKQPEALEFRAKKTHLAIFILLPHITLECLHSVPQTKLHANVFTQAERCCDNRLRDVFHG
ncbi:hypothetical protein T4C_8161 [Trichinella pseudospiralis]|uniref:Uncharacterized protein n=1 Tax=Trichinella pseudospiralis TaxID=6337 RepID=A0A0V1GWU8_TRIPS|nr:hypothetical protein T4C_8161 [Trichinella pseudospiralis]